jgi:hypothetical protein
VASFTFRHNAVLADPPSTLPVISFVNVLAS